MSLTGIGLDSSCSGGSFLGKKNSSSWRESGFQSGSSKLSWAKSKCSSGSVPGLGLISGASILFDLPTPVRERSVALKHSLYTDEHFPRQVASFPCANLRME